MKTSAYQRGITIWGLMFVVAFIAIVVLFSVRAFPLYNEKMQVIKAMNSVAAQPNASRMDVGEARRSFYKAIQVTNIDRFNDRNLKDHVNVIKPKEKGNPRILEVKYQATNKLFADLQLLMEFDYSVPLTGVDSDG